MIEQLLRIAAWLSQGINVLFLKGSEDMTVSARCHVQQDELRWNQTRIILNKIFFWQADHCKTSFQQDEIHANEVIELSRKVDNNT